MAPVKRVVTPPAPGGATGGGGAPAAGGAAGGWGAPGAAGTAGVASPSAAGRARSIRFNRDMGSILPSTACEESALGGLIGLIGWSLADDRASESGKIARERRLGV